MSFNLEGPLDNRNKTNDSIAIKVSNVSKNYHIFERPIDRLKQLIVPYFQRLMGIKESKFYTDYTALKDINFEVKRGETVGVIGRNGAGKSTLLQIICGTLSPTCGEVEINGRVAALLELGSGFNLEFTGRENIYMNATVLGLERHKIYEKFDKIVEFADIGEYIDQPVKTYSSGMIVRLAFAVIAHVDADILIIDEALSVGDAFFAQKCMRFLRNFVKNGTILFVSHDTGAVVNFCDNAIMLNDGEVALQGTPKKVTEYYLANIYRNKSEILNDQNQSEPVSLILGQTDDISYRDMRDDLFNSSTLRNDIEIFKFNQDVESFGQSGARIVETQLCDLKDQPLSWLIGGETVSILVRVKVLTSLHSPIIGFHIKDRLGQILFCDNTYLTHMDHRLDVTSGEIIEAKFTFQMPKLPTGDYTISPAIADGSIDNHIQHHWLHDALAFKVHASPIVQGLVGVPMLAIQLQKMEN